MMEQSSRGHVIFWTNITTVPTSPLGWWEDGEILGRRDGEAGGTWLACTRSGRLAFVTNAQRLRYSFKDMSNKYGQAEISIEEVTGNLMGDTTKDDQSKLPLIYPPEFEWVLSAVVLRTSGDVIFYERHLEKDLWKEKAICYHMEKEKATC
ncbi:unnamed protein product [Fraxinus pennsylvanica]|uniref:Uncharacterized protein n=1 Tax=Fraxinus pennsylvanica TaxID=56036 RepID=A0AAD1ZG76_9LAMI|nr:unnamed protein product [Fraxinus pennsylvanica]